MDEEYNKGLQRKYADKLLSLIKVMAEEPKRFDDNPALKSEFMLCGKVAAITAIDHRADVCEIIRNHVINEKKRLVK